MFSRRRGPQNADDRLGAGHDALNRRGVVQLGLDDRQPFVSPVHLGRVADKDYEVVAGFKGKLDELAARCTDSPKHG